MKSLADKVEEANIFVLFYHVVGKGMAFTGIFFRSLIVKQNVFLISQYASQRRLISREKLFLFSSERFNFNLCMIFNWYFKILNLKFVKISTLLYGYKRNLPYWG